ncbi:nucleoside-diphosphate kinase [Amycolatopsis orientalis]|uniref:nucleoside-diphosphate kinase n=1 Tax=Amycolatopsis orientalis TaxID=31958 RepID=UPI00039BC39F|nr:nucleoside-diphosphate kinase [Amycolatopsis orientalis]
MIWTPGREDRVDGMPTTEEWRQLSVVPEKREVFGCDLYFREGWADMLAVFGSAAAEVLGGLAMLVVKPDAVAGRRLGAILEYLADNGFLPVATTRFGYTRHSMREVWRYDWHIYPVDRLQLCTFWYLTNDVLLFLARDVRPVAGLPATVRLGDLKGVGDPAGRRPHHLRTKLNPPNRILNFVHVGDEPADIVRELTIFLDRSERLRFLEDLRAHLGEDRTALARAEIAALEAECPAHDLDLRATLSRLVPLAGEAAVDRLRAVLDGGDRIGWDDLAELVPFGEADRWDVIVTASFVVRDERPVPHALLPPVSVEAWIEQAAGR